jgi:RNA polymerase-interacting CarD/CdnL/TRCF family regulator
MEPPAWRCTQCQAGGFLLYLGKRRVMSFQIGDKVIHCTYGLGEIVHIEEKNIRDQFTNCYVFHSHGLTIWIPINDLHQNSLRMPASPDEFVRLFAVLTSPGEALPEDRVMRKDQLLEHMKDGQLMSIGQVVRDLTHFRRIKKLNDQERSILGRATNSLITEWIFSLGVTQIQAQQAMTQLLGE